jgi:predicted flap endonuclease-1-like 5' DNA nuclease
VSTCEELLDRAGTAKGRAALAAQTGIGESLILRWANHADLMRISGVGPQYAELLEAAGVDTVKELAQRNAANLAKRMAEVNAAKRLAGGTPAESQVSGWITQAQNLEPKITH